MNSTTPPQERRSRPIGTVRMGTPVLVGIVIAISAPIAVAATYLDGGIADDTYANNAAVPMSPVGSVDHLIVNGQNARMTVIGSPTATEVTATAHVKWAGGAQKPTVSQQVTGGTLALGFACGKNDGDCGVQWDVTVPAGVNLDAATTNAAIRLTNLTGTVNAKTSNAAINAAGLGSGDTVLRSTNGPIDATFVGGPKNITVTTTNDPINVKTDGKTKYYYDVSTTNGTATYPPENRTATDTVSVHTVNDDVTVS
jgi:hypothetical protein